VSDEPLVPGPLYGLRTWIVVAEDGRERLRGLHQGGEWPTGDGWLEAECASAGEHHPPERDCECGIHAWHPTLKNARRVLASKAEVAGVVEASGAVEVHEEGFRAERARPYALVSTPSRNGKRVQRLAETYATQVIEVRKPEELLAWCRERGLGMDERVVAELLGPEWAQQSARRKRARRRNNILRVAAALVISALLLALGALIHEPNGPRTLYGRTGEIHTR
jgi:hypothetical protein